MKNFLSAVALSFIISNYSSANPVGHSAPPKPIAEAANIQEAQGSLIYQTVSKLGTCTQPKPNNQAGDILYQLKKDLREALVVYIRNGAKKGSFEEPVSAANILNAFKAQMGITDDSSEAVPALKELSEYYHSSFQAVYNLKDRIAQVNVDQADNAAKTSPAKKDPSWKFLDKFEVLKQGSVEVEHNGLLTHLDSLKDSANERYIDTLDERSIGKILTYLNKCPKITTPVDQTAVAAALASPTPAAGATAGGATPPAPAATPAPEELVNPIDPKEAKDMAAAAEKAKTESGEAEKKYKEMIAGAPAAQGVLDSHDALAPDARRETIKKLKEAGVKKPGKALDAYLASKDKAAAVTKADEDMTGKLDFFRPSPVTPETKDVEAAVTREREALLAKLKNNTEAGLPELKEGAADLNTRHSITPPAAHELTDSASLVAYKQRLETAKASVRGKKNKAEIDAQIALVDKQLTAVQTQKSVSEKVNAPHTEINPFGGVAKYREGISDSRLAKDKSRPDLERSQAQQRYDDYYAAIGKLNAEIEALNAEKKAAASNLLTPDKERDLKDKLEDLEEAQAYVMGFIQSKPKKKKK